MHGTLTASSFLSAEKLCPGRRKQLDTEVTPYEVFICSLLTSRLRRQLTYSVFCCCLALGQCVLRCTSFSSVVQLAACKSSMTGGSLQRKAEKLSGALEASQAQARQADSEVKELEKAFQILQDEVCPLAQ